MMNTGHVYVYVLGYTRHATNSLDVFRHYMVCILLLLVSQQNVSLIRLEWSTLQQLRAMGRYDSNSALTRDVSRISAQ